MALRLELVAALKRLLKAQGLTYAQLAQRIGLSEAAVKRMFSRQTIRLEHLDRICETLGVGLSELASEARRGTPTLAELEASAEQSLVENPLLLLALYLTLNRWTEEEALSRYRFSKAEWTALLVKLDRLGVIELLPENRYRVLTARNFRWRRNGPMERFLLQRLPSEFLDRPFLGPNERLILLNGMMTPASAEKIARLLSEAAEEFDALLAADAVLPVSERIGISLVLAERPWVSLKLFDKWRRFPAVETQQAPHG